MSGETRKDNIRNRHVRETLSGAGFQTDHREKTEIAGTRDEKIKNGIVRKVLRSGKLRKTKMG